MEEELWLSAEEMAQWSARGVPGLPGTARGSRDKAQREGWPAKQVQGKGGPGGLKTLYRPPASILAAIRALDPGSDDKGRGSTAVADAICERDDYEEWAESLQIAGAFVPVRYYRNARVSAGHGAVNGDERPEALLFSKSFLRTLGAAARDLFLVRVKGDSMLPTLQAGWTVMLDTSRTTVSSGIYVIRLGDEEMCKRLEARPGGIIRVISDNKVYDEYEIDTASAGSDFAVLGKVVWFAGLVQ